MAEVSAQSPLLVAATEAHLVALIESHAIFEDRFALRVEPGYLEFPGALEFSLKQLRAHPEDAEWWTPRFFVLESESAVIGLGGYKGPPDADGQVEIGYGIAPAFRGLGLGTAGAAALVADAFAHAAVNVVRAHTLAVRSASTGILEKCGFRLTGQVWDEDDGRLWRWERAR